MPKSINFIKLSQVKAGNVAVITATVTGLHATGELEPINYIITILNKWVYVYEACNTNTVYNVNIYLFVVSLKLWVFSEASVSWVIGSDTYTTGGTHPGFKVTNEDITVNGITKSRLTINGGTVTVDATPEFQIAVEGAAFTLDTKLKTFDVIMSTKEVQVGFAASLTCYVRSVSQRPNIKWTERENTFVKDGTHSGFLVTNSELVGGAITSTLTIAADKVRILWLPHGPFLVCV